VNRTRRAHLERGRESMRGRGPPLSPRRPLVLGMIEARDIPCHANESESRACGGPSDVTLRFAARTVTRVTSQRLTVRIRTT
jgi:hypothetical protein